MKRFLTGFALLALAVNAMTYCSKKKPSVELSLLQHKWMIQSLNGEVFRYVGTAQDYFDFGTNQQLIAYVNGKYDTSAYTLTGGGNDLTLLLNHIANGKKSDTAFGLIIGVLSSSQLILQAHLNPSVYILDSLRR